LPPQGTDTPATVTRPLEAIDLIEEISTEKTTEPRFIAGPELSPSAFHCATLPLDSGTAERVRQDNAAGHPMGPPANLWLSAGAMASKWEPAGCGPGMPDIPVFLARNY
jgi:hypothetical protein